jgi:diguanylate cyclase (GGDEF)-like protein
VTADSSDITDDGFARARRRGASPSGWVSSVGLLLTALAVLPLAGAGWFAAQEFGDANRARDRARSIQSDTAVLVELTSIRTNILDERNWVLVTLGLAEISITPAVALQLTGIDIAAELDSALDEVDRTVATFGDEELAAEVQRTRASSASLVERGAAYLAIEAGVTARSDALIGSLLNASGAVQDGGLLVESLRSLEAATEARQATALQLTNYFTAIFPDTSADGDAGTALVDQHVLGDHALAQMWAIAPTGGATHAALLELDESPGVASFASAIHSRVTDILRNGSTGSPVSQAALFANVDEVAAVFRNGATAADAYLDVVNGAAADVEDATGEITRNADAERTRSVVLMGLLILISLVSAVAVASFIVAPLRELAAQARRVRDGRPADRAVHRGPREVREAQMAIGEAAANLELAERQANALAKGELSHSVLTESVPGALGSSLREAVQTLASSLGEREEFRKRLAHEAAHDGLTALPNRTATLALLHRGLARTRRKNQNLAVLFIDLDGFKDVNDEHGHLVGDHGLCITAQRLLDSVRDNDHVGRLGGDEFLVIAEQVASVEEAMMIAEQIRRVINQPITAGDITFAVDASIGVALTDGRDPTADELLYDADVAVYRAKDLGRGRTELCDDELRHTIAEYATLERAVVNAIESDELVLHYQATVDNVTGSMCSAEALVRWQRPNHGIVLPGEFIDFAERSELIVEIDTWVLRSAARQLQQWEGDETFGSLSVSVNISGRHFESEGFVDNVVGPLEEFGVNPSLLTLEITESALLSDLQHAAVKLQTLRDMGVKIAIDDFGTGYTSLAYLRALPFDILKIDRSFIADQSAESFVKLIIDTGHLIGATITAEGVETLDQVHMLTRLGCDHLQGYYFARPCPPSEIAVSGLSLV